MLSVNEYPPSLPDDDDMVVDSDNGASDNNHQSPQSTHTYSHHPSQHESDASADGSPDPSLHASPSPRFQPQPTATDQFFGGSESDSADDDDADGDAEDEEYPVTTSNRSSLKDTKGKGVNGGHRNGGVGKIDLSNADPALYGLRRSVSRLVGALFF
jgi:hypothetical protein